MLLLSLISCLQSWLTYSVLTSPTVLVNLFLTPVQGSKLDMPSAFTSLSAENCRLLNFCPSTSTAVLLASLTLQPVFIGLCIANAANVQMIAVEATHLIGAALRRHGFMHAEETRSHQLNLFKRDAVWRLSA